MCKNNDNGRTPSCIEAKFEGPGCEDWSLCAECADSMQTKVLEWKECAGAQNDALAKVTAEKDALLLQIETLKNEQAQVDGRGNCSSHACLREKPKGMGTNSGKCYCTQGELRRFVEHLKVDKESCCAGTEVLRVKLEEQVRLVATMKNVVDAAVAYEVDQETWDRLSKAVDAYKASNPEPQKCECGATFTSDGHACGYTKQKDALKRNVSRQTCGREYTVGINDYSTCSRVEGHSGLCGRHTISGENFPEVEEDELIGGGN